MKVYFHTLRQRELEHTEYAEMEEGMGVKKRGGEQAIYAFLK